MLEHFRFICSGGSFDGVVRYSSCAYFHGTLLQNWYVSPYRCGADLATLFKSPAVQSFVNGTPSRTLLHSKRIYQPGTLRKVINFYTTCYSLNMQCFQVAEKHMPLGNLPIRVRGMGTLTVQQMLHDCTFTLLLMSLSGSTPVYQATSVIGSKRCDLVNVGDSVEFFTAPGEVVIMFMVCV